MSIIPKPFEPEYENDKAEWASNDLFERNEFGKNFANLIEASGGSTVFALYANWGEGKTTFLEIWKRYLENFRKMPVIKIDAFETDYFEDPFLCLVGEVFAFAESREGVNEGVVEELKEKGVKVGKIVLRTIGGIGARALSAGVLGGKDAEETGKAVSDIFDVLMDKSISEYAKEKEALQRFRETLEKLGESLGNGRPLVVIIDELDRCKPTYALDLLERVKHLFTVQNVVFVLSMNRKQMESSIKVAYGDDVEASDYLNKFIHLPVTLPMNEGRINRASYTISLFDSMGYEPFVVAGFPEFVGSFFQAQQTSLREIERIVTLLSISRGSAGSSGQFFELLSFVLAYLKVKQRELFERSCRYENVAPEIEKIIMKMPDHPLRKRFLSCECSAFGARNAKYQMPNNFKDRLNESQMFSRDMARKSVSPKELLQYHIDLLSVFSPVEIEGD